MPGPGGLGASLLSTLQEGDAPTIDDEENPHILFEASLMPQSGGDDDVYGLGFFAYPEEPGWGVGFQVQGTVRTIDPEVDVLLDPPASEQEGRTRAWTIDAVATRRLTRRLGVFAGVGVATFEDFRRFTDLVGTSFFISTGRDVEINGTAGFHFFVTDAFTVSAQYDSAFDAASFGLGYRF